MKEEEREFDESWYLLHHTDVAKAVAEGRFRSAEAHYREFGEQEKRKARWRKRGRVFSYGAYGSNNVGDEAILEGVRRIYPDCIQLHVIHPRSGTGTSVEYNLAKEKGFFKKGDHLILGGGGLLYSREVVELMTLFARRVIEAGGVVDIARMGCESAHPDYHDAIRELFSLARYVSVRSTASREIIRDICKRDVPFENDFAMELQPQVLPATGSREDIPVIGLVLASIEMPHLRLLANQLKRYLQVGARKRARFVLIPHSRSFFDTNNNDSITSEILRTLLGNPNEVRTQDFVQLPFSADPAEVLSRYREMDGIISSRYHGLIFAHLLGLPTLALGVGYLKMKSFVDDHPSDLMMEASWPQPDDLEDKLAEFYGAVAAWKKAASGKVA